MAIKDGFIVKNGNRSGFPAVPPASAIPYDANTNVKDKIDTKADTSAMETALAGKQATLTFDNVPTDGSNNPVKSDGIYDALATKQVVPTEISYADWQLLTPQQQESGSWLVQGVPSANLSSRVSALESGKQNASGNSSLTTTDKTIVGAINEVNSNFTNSAIYTSVTGNTTNAGVVNSQVPDTSTILSAWAENYIVVPYINSGIWKFVVMDSTSNGIVAIGSTSVTVHYIYTNVSRNTITA